MANQKRSLCNNAVTSIILLILTEVCVAVVCPTYPLGIFGSHGDISYSAIATYKDKFVIVGGSCRDS